MDAHESLRIQSFLEATQGEAQHVARACGMRDDAIIVRLEPRNVRDWHWNEVSSRSNEQPADPTAVRRTDGKWDVSVPVEARKYQLDERGAETETTLNERIEVGLFAAPPGRDAVDAKDALVIERRPIRSGAQVLEFVTDRRPTHAGIDPYNYYIDRNSADNVRPLAAAQ